MEISILTSINLLEIFCFAYLMCFNLEGVVLFDRRRVGLRLIDDTSLNSDRKYTVDDPSDESSMTSGNGKLVGLANVVRYHYIQPGGKSPL